MAQIGYGPRPCKQEKVTWIAIFSDRFQASFICGNESDMCICACCVIRYSPVNATPMSCFGNILLYRHTCNKGNISYWVAEYSFRSFVLNKRRSDAEMCCFWNHAEGSLQLLSVMTVRAQTSASVAFVLLKPQNKMHTNMSVIYNNRWMHLVLITKKTPVWHA